MSIGNFKKWKAGDTRSEFAAIVNAATSAIILFGFIVVGIYNCSLEIYN